MPLGWLAADLIYRTLQLIPLELGSVNGKVNWMLETARFLLPALTAYTALQAVMHLFREQTQRLRLWGLHGHVIVCGLGRKGSHLTRQLLALGIPVVIVEKETQHENAAELQAAGCHHSDRRCCQWRCFGQCPPLPCPPFDLPAWRGSSKYPGCIPGLPVDRGRRKGMLTCIVHIASPGLLDLIKSSELSMDSGIPFQLETFNPYASAARLLLQEDPGWQGGLGAAKVPAHLLVIGLGRLGESLILRAAYTWYSMKKRGRLRVTVLDRDAKEKSASLLQKHAQLGKVCQIIPVQVDLNSTHQLLGGLKNLRDQAQIQRVYLCLSDPILSQQVCLTLPLIHWLRPVPVRACMANDSELSVLLKKPLPGETHLQQVIPFDLYERTCSADLVVGGSHELLARGLHDLYLAGDQPPHGDQASRQSWDQLAEQLKDANRRQANRIHHLLASTNYRINPLQNWEAGEYKFEPGEIELMARMEHELWQQARQADGWKYGSQKNEKKRLHPDLVAWNELPESERQKNRLMVSRLPVLLARIGFQIDKQ